MQLQNHQPGTAKPNRQHELVRRGLADVHLTRAKLGELSIAQMTNEKGSLALTHLVDRNPGSGEACGLSALA
jgi:hypothetical protein